MRRKKSTIILLTYVGIIRIRLKGQDETRPISADYNLSAPLRSIFNNYYIRLWSFVKSNCRKAFHLCENSLFLLLKTLLKRLKSYHVFPPFVISGQAVTERAERQRKSPLFVTKTGDRLRKASDNAVVKNEHSSF